MTPLVTLRQALEDPQLLGASLAGPTWHAWRSLLLAAMGEPLQPDEHGVNYEPSEKPESELYRDRLPLLNSCAVNLLEHDKLATQLISLERRTSRGGKDSIDHAPVHTMTLRMQ